VKVVEIIKKISTTNNTSIKGMRLISGSGEAVFVPREKPLLDGECKLNQLIVPYQLGKVF
jgi:hypothetical protein